MNIFSFESYFLWNIFLKVELVQQGLRSRLDASRQQTSTWTIVEWNSWRHMSFKHTFCVSNFRPCNFFLAVCLLIALALFGARLSEGTVLSWHYNGVIMGTIASQITSLTIVYSTVYPDADQRKHQSSASLAFVRVIHRGPVNSPHKWPVTQKMFPFNDVIMDSCSQAPQEFILNSVAVDGHGIKSKKWKMAEVKEVGQNDTWIYPLSVI